MQNEQFELRYVLRHYLLLAIITSTHNLALSSLDKKFFDHDFLYRQIFFFAFLPPGKSRDNAFSLKARGKGGRYRE